jgi:Flp pilus assembly protein TadG
MLKMRNQSRNQGETGNAMVEFALVMAFLVPMFAATFTIGAALSKGIQVSNICRDAVVLMVRSSTDPNEGLDLSQTQNQRIIVRAATGLGMASDASYDPSTTGNGVLILSKVVDVGPAECSLAGLTPHTTAPFWDTSNCANFGSYVFAYRVVIGNTTRWTSQVGTPPSGDVLTNGTISAHNIATDTSNRAVSNFSTGVVALTASTYALIAEMYADVSYLNIFSIWNTPIIYSRTIS